MSTQIVYIVRLWIDPEGEPQVLNWLEGGHLAEVLRLPGFQSVTRVRLEQQSDDGWICHAMIYNLESQEALDAYFGNTQLAAKFDQERAPFVQYLRLDRMWGNVESDLRN